MDDQIIMALLIILGLRFRVVSKEAKEYFMV
jgi:hypothetical protein